MLMEIAVSEPSASRRAVTPTKSLGFISSSTTARRRMTTVSPVTATRTWVPALVVTVTAAGSTAASVPSAWVDGPGAANATAERTRAAPATASPVHSSDPTR